MYWKLNPKLTRDGSVADRHTDAAPSQCTRVGSPVGTDCGVGRKQRRLWRRRLPGGRAGLHWGVRRKAQVAGVSITCRGLGEGQEVRRLGEVIGCGQGDDRGQ